MASSKSRTTHFLCFPIASAATVPTLAESITRFQKVASKPESTKRKLVTGPDGRLTVATDAQGLKSTTHDDPLGNLSRPVQEPDTSRLQILPSITQRPAGTFHLTLGVMDLSDSSAMERATSLLHSLDLRVLLRKAVHGPPPGSKAARVWSDQDSKPSEIFTVGGAVQSDNHLPLHISLRGLGAFPSRKRARVIWARPVEQTQNGTDRLQNFALHISQAFRDEGFIKETRPLTLHATVSNMRYAVQAKGGRTSKGRAWQKSKWQDGQVDARELVDLFNKHRGDVSRWQSAGMDEFESEDCEEEAEEDHDDMDSEEAFVWVDDVLLDRVAICKLGAVKNEDGMWGEWYPPIEEKMI